MNTDSPSEIERHITFLKAAKACLLSPNSQRLTDEG